MCLDLDRLLLQEAEPNPPKQSAWILKCWDIFLRDALPGPTDDWGFIRAVDMPGLGRTLF